MLKKKRLVRSRAGATYFNAALFRWYKKHGRHSLPWRKTRDPYKILASEVMLQQTQVGRALLKYCKFLRRFPTVAALASAPLGDVLRAWSGLGYNRRARYLHDCAKWLMASGGAQWPHTFSGLLELPGIGPSTAAAISSFSFDADEPMIDTNIRRIVVRVFFKHAPHVIAIRQPAEKQSYNIPSDKLIYAFAKTLIPKGRGTLSYELPSNDFLKHFERDAARKNERYTLVSRKFFVASRSRNGRKSIEVELRNSRLWNWAMMDVGALLCKAKGHSDACPFQTLHGPVGDFTYKKPQKKFAGSDRYFRGRILALLAEATGGVTANTLCRKLKITTKKLSPIISALRRESLIKMSGKKLLLP